MDLRDVFGQHPGRPDHPDFWRMADAVLQLDGSMEDIDGSLRNDAPQAWQQSWASVCDLESATYMAESRCAGICLQIGAPPHLVPLMAAAWLDAFAVGVTFERKGGHA
jgi:hypothetical protein